MIIRQSLNFAAHLAAGAAVGALLVVLARQCRQRRESRYEAADADRPEASPVRSEDT